MIRLDTSAYTVPTDAPEGDGTFAWTSTTLVLVRATDGDATGLGWTYGPAAVVSIVDDLLAAEVASVDSDDVPAAWLAMQQRLRNAGRPGVGGLALSAVDCALWDPGGTLLMYATQMMFFTFPDGPPGPERRRAPEIAGD